MHCVDHTLLSKKQSARWGDIVSEWGGMQVMEAALARGTAPLQAASAAVRAFDEAQAGLMRTSEAEKSFTSKVTCIANHLLVITSCILSGISIAREAITPSAAAYPMHMPYRTDVGHRA